MARYNEMPLFRIGISLIIFLIFSAAWLKGMRYDDVSWIVLLSAITASQDYSYINGLQLDSATASEFIEALIILTQLGFAISFLRLRRVREYYLFVYLIVIVILSVLFLSVDKEDILLYLKDYNLPLITGGILLFATSAIAYFKGKQLAAPKQRLNRIFILALICQLAAVAYFAEDYLSDKLSIRLSIYIDALLLINSAVFLAVDLIVFQRQYFAEKVAHAQAREEMMINRARGEIFAKFLSRSLTDRFSRYEEMGDRLDRILKPHVGQVALLQADIRGFSEIATKMNALDLVQTLQSYYRDVIDLAQNVAQVKLIGDCIFLFIEEENMLHSNKSAIDHAVEIAVNLIKNANQQNVGNKATLGFELNFGIAIHYGEVVIGNLSSENCIDYTVIGNNVNLVARLEEYTKNSSVKSKIGNYGVILTEEAVKNVTILDRDKFAVLATTEQRVRSFPGISQVRYITSSELLDQFNPDKLAG